MSGITEGWRRLRALLRRRTFDSGLDEEIRFHLDQQTEKLRRAGMSPEEARRRALLKFGGVDRAREDVRDEARPALLEDSVRDLRHGLRLLRRAPGFTAAALITLALGIGATSAIFSIVRTVLLAPLPYHDPDRLVVIWETNRGAKVRNAIAPANYVAWLERARSFEHLGMIGPVSAAMVLDRQPDQIDGFTVSYDVFRALGVQPALGRAYTEDEDVGGQDAVIVLGHEFWQQRLGGRADVLGLTLTTDGRSRTVIGVMPPGFTILGMKTDFLIPYGLTLAQMRAVSGRNGSIGLARLRDGVSLEQASTEMRTLFAELVKEFPQPNAGRTVWLVPVQEQTVGEIRPALVALMAAVALVLLVACVNVANLLLARSAARERELGLRAALGAGRARLVRQMLIESLLLAAAGGVAGLGVAALCHRGLLALVRDRIPIPRIEQLSLDLPVVAFTLITALATGMLFGLLPAFVSTRTGGDALREGGRHAGGRRLHGALRTLVIGEVALSLVLLAGAGLLLRSFVKLQQIDPGFRTDGVLTVSARLPPARYEAAQAAGFLSDALARVAALPGVERAAGATCLPPPAACIGTSVWRVDQPKPAPGQLLSSQIRPVTPGFFATMATPLRAGRDFSAADTAESAPVAIVSERVVRDVFGDEDPLGRRLRINVDHANGRDDMEWTIVGVAGDVRSSENGEVARITYVPVPQRPQRSLHIFVRRAQGDPLALANSVTAIIHDREPDAPLDVRTLEDIVSNTIARPRALSTLVGLFALVALALAAVGVYGVMAYSVRARTQEIGVRMALGATSSSVCRLVLGQALRLVSIGVAAGLIAAGLLTRLLERLLYDVEPLDPWTFAGTAVVLLAVATLASYVPARRGMRIAPVDALRTK